MTYNRTHWSTRWSKLSKSVILQVHSNRTQQSGPLTHFPCSHCNYYSAADMILHPSYIPCRSIQLRHHKMVCLRTLSLDAPQGQDMTLVYIREHIAREIHRHM